MLAQLGCERHSTVPVGGPTCGRETASLPTPFCFRAARPSFDRGKNARSDYGDAPFPRLQIWSRSQLWRSRPDQAGRPRTSKVRFVATIGDHPIRALIAHHRETSGLIQLRAGYKRSPWPTSSTELPPHPPHRAQTPPAAVIPKRSPRATGSVREASSSPYRVEQSPRTTPTSERGFAHGRSQPRRSSDSHDHLCGRRCLMLRSRTVRSRAGPALDVPPKS